jgi:4-diphosphocytidyl-2-C-methyl-D-erythritol kinase
VGELQADGYHEIDTVMQAVELHDVLTFSLSDATRVRCSNALLNGESNLVFKAYRLASEFVDLPRLDVYIEKRIPTQAGLGGGSSDAAAALRVFDRISGGVLGSHINEIGLACGSDVPFFLGSGTRARATGRGEALQKIEVISEEGLVLAKPLTVSCNTADAYRRLDQIRKAPNHRPKTMPFNDFERVAPCESLELLDRLQVLGVANCGLCGSGSAVYGFTDETEKVAEDLRSECVWSVATKTITKFGDPWTP